MRDAAQFVIDHIGDHIDGAFVCGLNATISRSGALHPGRLRTSDQQIGVSTAYGRHEPPALTEAELDNLIERAIAGTDISDAALNLFVDLAKAQPFEDGNKRTAIFAANSLLLGAGAPVLLTVPVDDNDPGVARGFNDTLARAYLYDDRQAVKDLLRRRGLTPRQL